MAESVADSIKLADRVNRIGASATLAVLADAERLRAQGVDVVGRYRLTTDAHGDTDFTVAANFNDVEVTRVPTSSSVLSPPKPRMRIRGMCAVVGIESVLRPDRRAGTLPA